jgi:putative Holliday junction resolvase
MEEAEEGAAAMIILGLDYGEARIGVAVCDELEIAAHPLPTIEVDGRELERIEQYVRDRGVERIVVGLPLTLEGRDGVASRRVRGFVKDLKKYVPGPDVVTMDERLTTAQAHAALREMGARPAERRRRVDAMAAQIILQRYLERRRAGRQG